MKGNERIGKLAKIEKFSAKGKVDKLFPFVHDADRQVCLAAIQALGKFTGQMDVMGALSQILDDGDTELRRAAAAALSSAEGSYAESILMHRLEQEKDAGVQNAMRDALASIKSRTK